MDMNDIFGEVANAELFGERGVYIKQGKYVLEVKSLAVEKKRKGPFFFGEFIVRTAKPLDKDIPSNDVGDVVTYVMNMSKDAAGSNLKRLLIAASAGKETDLSQGVIAKIFGKGEPLKGALVECRAELRKASHDGEYMHYTWTAIDSKPDEVAARAKAQG